MEDKLPEVSPFISESLVPLTQFKLLCLGIKNRTRQYYIIDRKILQKVRETWTIHQEDHTWAGK